MVTGSKARLTSPPSSEVSPAPSTAKLFSSAHRARITIPGLPPEFGSHPRNLLKGSLPPFAATTAYTPSYSLFRPPSNNEHPTIADLPPNPRPVTLRTPQTKETPSATPSSDLSQTQSEAEKEDSILAAAVYSDTATARAQRSASTTTSADTINYPGSQPRRGRTTANHSGHANVPCLRLRYRPARPTQHRHVHGDLAGACEVDVPLEIGRGRSVGGEGAQLACGGRGERCGGSEAVGEEPAGEHLPFG